MKINLSESYGLDLLDQLGRRLGLDLKFDEVNQCMLMFDAQIVSIRNEEHSWIIYGMVRELEGVRTDAFWRELLAMNLVLLKQGGGGVALQPQTNALLYVNRVPLPMEFDQLYRKLEQFVECHERICKQISDVGSI